MQPTADGPPAGTGLLDVDLRDAAWLTRLDPTVALPPGAPAPTVLRVPAAEAQKVLRDTVRFVADIPKGSSLQFVWVQGADELRVDAGEIELACDTGLVTIGLRVGCDQLARDAVVAVPLAVGTAERPAGLVMSTLTRPVGPELVVDGWSGALVAFAWEALLHLAQALCAAAGSDAARRALVPAGIAAQRRLLLIQPAARHDFTTRTGRP